jgi:hypothetical protein
VIDSHSRTLRLDAVVADSPIRRLFEFADALASAVSLLRQSFRDGFFGERRQQLVSRVVEEHPVGRQFLLEIASAL